MNGEIAVGILPSVRERHIFVVIVEDRFVLPLDPSRRVYTMSIYFGQGSLCSIFSTVTGFQWDEGNIDKDWIKHKVTHLECEQPFFNEPFLVGNYPVAPRTHGGVEG
jgi:hypothetical protein